MRTKTMVVGKVIQEHDRVLIYDNSDDISYHIIAKADEKIESGDTIEYEPYGYNFGFFVSKVKSCEK